MYTLSLVPVSFKNISQITNFKSFLSHTFTHTDTDTRFFLVRNSRMRRRQGGSLMTRIELVLIIASTIVHFHVDELVIVLIAAAVVHVPLRSGASLLVLLLHALVLGAPVLEPDFHLRLREV